jgi:hypothetical protein
MLLDKQTKDRLRLKQAQCYLECIEDIASDEEIQKLKWAAIYLIQFVAQGTKPDDFEAVIEAAEKYTQMQLH